jgi:hypothetical protein
MAMNQDLLLAILAMDSYNRGYNAGISTLSNAAGTLIGTAIPNTNLANTAASFYGQSYTLYSGQRDISYRGTDQAFPSWQEWTLGDVLTGWGTATGFSGVTQA